MTFKNEAHFNQNHMNMKIKYREVGLFRLTGLFQSHTKFIIVIA